jgi:hypothetical protein
MIGPHGQSISDAGNCQRTALAPSWPETVRSMMSLAPARSGLQRYWCVRAFIAICRSSNCCDCEQCNGVPDFLMTALEW